MAATPTTKQPTKPVRIVVRAVYGRMIDPHTGEEFDTMPKELDALSDWAKFQLQEGKLAQVEASTQANNAKM